MTQGNKRCLISLVYIKDKSRSYSEEYWSIRMGLNSKVGAFSKTPKIYYSTLEELIELLDINHLPEKQLVKFTKFPDEHKGVFSRHDLDIGCVEDYYAKVTLTEEVKNFSMKHVPIPRNLRPKVDSTLERYKKENIIAECQEDIP